MTARLTVFLLDAAGRTVACGAVRASAPGDGSLYAAEAFRARIHLDAPIVAMYVHWPALHVGARYAFTQAALAPGTEIEIALHGTPLLQFPMATDVPCAVVEGDANVIPATGGVALRHLM
jgi:hypothetical protein